MPGLGTLINAAAIALGGLAGLLFGRFLSAQRQETLGRTCGVSTMFIGIAGAMEGMLSLKEGGLASGGGMLVTLSLVLGGLVGELMDIEGFFERFGEWLKRRVGATGEAGFVNGFVTASLTVCIGAMAVVGSIRDGLLGDPSVLVNKAILDFIIVLVMTSAMGRGCAFSAIPVLALEGGMTALSRLLEPVMTPGALGNLGMVGSILIFCVGLNLVFGKRIRVGNLLPALVLAVIAAFLPG